MLIIAETQCCALVYIITVLSKWGLFGEFAFFNGTKNVNIGFSSLIYTKLISFALSPNISTAYCTGTFDLHVSSLCRM